MFSLINRIKNLTPRLKSCLLCSTSSKHPLTLRGTNLTPYINQLKPDQNHQIAPHLAARAQLLTHLANLAELAADPELEALARDEQADLERQLKTVDDRILEALLAPPERDPFDEIVLEVSTGVGGQEAMLFAKQLFDMYAQFATHRGWRCQVAEYARTELGGLRRACLLLAGAHAFRLMRHEGGVHRVQRIPATERAGRVHTSTVAVVALPQPGEVAVRLDARDLRVETKRASGAGGQHVNTTDSAVRILHVPSGVSVDCQVDRSQIKNRQIAMAKLRALLYEREVGAQAVESSKVRRGQVRTNFRNEKIRTYNFPQDRITDHRLQGNVHNLKGFLEGGQALDDLICKLDRESQIEELLKVVNSLK